MPLSVTYHSFAGAGVIYTSLQLSSGYHKINSKIRLLKMVITSVGRSINEQISQEVRESPSCGVDGREVHQMGHLANERAALLNVNHKGLLLAISSE